MRSFCSIIRLLYSLGLTSTAFGTVETWTDDLGRSMAAEFARIDEGSSIYMPRIHS